MCIRKIIVNLLVVSLFLSIASTKLSFQSSTTQLYVEPSKVEYWAPGALNRNFTINVNIADVSDLIGFELVLYWNTTLLDLIEVRIHDFLNPPSINITNEIREDLGRYTLKQLSTGESKNGSGSLVSLTFKVTYEPPWPQNAECALDLTNTKLSDPLGDPISHNVVDGLYGCYSALDITTAATKQSYFLLEPNVIHGNLTRGITPVPDGLVALQVIDPLSQTILVRTLQTGTLPANPLVEITNVFPCDSQGNPKSSFYRGNLAYFYVSAVNRDVDMRTVRFAVSVFDLHNIPIGVAAVKNTLAAGTPYSTILQVYLSDVADLGTAYVYANALTEWPSANGGAYCVEKSASFTVSGSGGSDPPRQPNTDPLPQRNYDFTLYIPFNGKRGNYIAYVGSLYHGQTDTASVMFQVKVPDLNGDNSVDIFDIVILAAAFGSVPGDPNWNLTADLNSDNIIDIFDLVIIASYFGWYAL